MYGFYRSYFRIYNGPPGGNLSGGSTPWNIERDDPRPQNQRHYKTLKKNLIGSQTRMMNTRHRGKSANIYR